VLTWACHRKCRHCYDDRFRPYVRHELKRVVAEGQMAYLSILNNLPDDMTFLDPAAGTRKRSLLVLAGGELLIDGVREELFYPALEAIRERWGERAPYISVQTTGDVLTHERIGAMLSRGVRTIAVASIDDYHVGFEGEKKYAFMEAIREMMAPFGAVEIDLGGARSEAAIECAGNGSRGHGGGSVLPVLWRATGTVDRRVVATWPRLGQRFVQRRLHDKFLLALERR